MICCQIIAKNANKYNIKVDGVKNLVPNLGKKLITMFTTCIYSYTYH